MRFSLLSASYQPTQGSEVNRLGGGHAGQTGVWGVGVLGSGGRARLARGAHSHGDNGKVGLGGSVLSASSSKMLLVSNVAKK